MITKSSGLSNGKSKITVIDQNGNQVGNSGGSGEAGQSAYELWLAEGNTGTETDFINSLRGVDGAPGIDGTNGRDGNDGATGPQGPQGPAGADGTNGTNGSDGLSAYQIWLNAGNSGTEQDFLDSLVGPQGPAGTGGGEVTLPSGLQILLYADEIDENGTVTVLNVKDYSLASNDYSRILIESEVSFQCTGDNEEWVDFIIYVDGTPVRTIPLKQDSTGREDEWKLAGPLKYSGTYTSGANISIAAKVVMGTGNWYVHSLRVYGII